MNNTPNLGTRRTKALIKPAPDEHIDPIETPDPAPAKALPPAVQPAAQEAAAAKSNAGKTRDLNLQVSEEVFETIDFAKYKTKLTKRAIVEQAVLAHWSKYQPS